VANAGAGVVNVVVASAILKGVSNAYRVDRARLSGCADSKTKRSQYKHSMLASG
jgi:hypothetical protein